MNCDNYTEQISAYIDGMLDSDEMQSVKAHIDSCEKCAVKYKAMSSLSEISVSLSDVKVPDCLMARVMDNINIPVTHPKLKKFILPAWVTDWRIYSSVAACVLAVFLVRTGIDKKYNSFYEESYDYTYESKITGNDIQNADAETAVSAEETAEPSPGITEQSPEDTATVTLAPTPDVLASVPETFADMTDVHTTAADSQVSAPADLNKRSLIPETEVNSIMSDAVPAPASVSSEAFAFNEADAKEAEENSATFSTKARSGGGATEGSASSLSEGGSLSNVKTSSSELDTQKEIVLSKYTFTEKSSMVKKSVTFVIANEADSAKAAALFSANASKGEAAVQSALSAAGISYTKNEVISMDYTSSYNALVRSGNSLKSQVSSAQIISEISTLDGKLSSVESELSAISRNCSVVELILNY